MKAIAGVVLGAGSSRRFGEDKLTQVIDDKPVVAHSVEAALASHLAEVVVVVRPGDGSLAAALPCSPRLRLVTNPHHLEGMSSSLRCGLRALGPHIKAAVVLLGDEPEVTSDSIASLVEAYLASDSLAVRTSYRGRIGHPVVLDRDLWPEIVAERGDVGARRILDRSRGVEVLEVGGRAPIDVDTKEDLEALRRRLSRN